MQLQLAVIIAAAAVVATVASALISILLQLQLAIVVWLLWTGVGYKTKIQLEWTVICSSSSSRRLLMLPPRNWEQWGGGSKAVPTWAKEFSFSLEVEVELKLRPKLSELCRRSRLKKLIALMTVSQREIESEREKASVASVVSPSAILPSVPSQRYFLLGQAHHIVHELLFIVS